MTTPPPSSSTDASSSPASSSTDASAAPASSSTDADDEPVPKLPRGGGFKLSTAAIVRIVMTAALLTMIIVAQRPCADAVSGFVTSFDNAPGSGSAATQMPKPGTVDVPRNAGSAGDYEQLRPDMTEDEIKAAIERAKAKAQTGEQPPTAAPAPADASPASQATPADAPASANPASPAPNRSN